MLGLPSLASTIRNWDGVLRFYFVFARACAKSDPTLLEHFFAARRLVQKHFAQALAITASSSRYVIPHTGMECKFADIIPGI